MEVLGGAAEQAAKPWQYLAQVQLPLVAAHAVVAVVEPCCRPRPGQDTRWERSAAVTLLEEVCRRLLVAGPSSGVSWEHVAQAGLAGVESEAEAEAVEASLAHRCLEPGVWACAQSEQTA